MGYYNRFQIKPSIEEIKEKLINTNQYKLFHDCILNSDFEWIFEDERKWYSWEKDCAELSKKLPFPFQVTREGEENDDIEIKVFHKGVVVLSWSPNIEYPNLLEQYISSSLDYVEPDSSAGVGVGNPKEDTIPGSPAKT